MSVHILQNTFCEARPKEETVFDIVAALALGAMFAVHVGVLVGLATIPVRAKLGAFTIATAWAVTIVTVAEMNGFRPGVLGPVPAAVLAFSALVFAWLVPWLIWPTFRRALLSLPVEALVGINGLRIGGVFFLLLFAEGRLSAPFAPLAGWGDIITGIAALLIAVRAASARAVSHRILAAWNAFGALDLVVAVTLAFLSAPGTRYHVFTDAPGTVVMTTLPWILVATLLVPLYLLTHFTIAGRLRLSLPTYSAQSEAATARRRTA
jgi:hypothetical protein